MNKSLLLAAPALLAVAAHAQTGTLQASLDVNTPTNMGIPGGTGNIGALGVAYVETTAGGRELHISARGSTDASGNYNANPPHSVFVYDLQGNLLRNYGQDPTSDATVWGYRDGASDHNWSDPAIFWGNDNGIYVMDSNGAARTTYMAANGVQTLPANPIAGTAQAVLANCRAVAYDPNGDSGNGSWWTATFGSDLIECDKNGNILTQHIFNGSWSLYGLAMDPITGMLWGNSSPNAGRLAEIDPATGQETGRTVIPGGNLAIDGIQGGLDIIGSGGVANSPVGGNDLVALQQSDPDRAIALKLSINDNFDYTNQDPLEVGKNSDPMSWTDQIAIRTSDTTLDVRVPNTTGTTQFGALFLNVNDSARQNATIANILPIVEFENFEYGFTLPFDLSMPMAPSVNLPIVAGAVLNLPIAPFTPLDNMGAQALMVTSNAPAGPQLPIYPTNRAVVDFCITNAQPQGITVSANGTNSFNTITTSGFFSVATSANSIPISKIRFTGVNGMVFDCDQTGSADQFDAGNSTTAGCLGTYRNGSDVACGLNYAAAGLAPVAACATAGSSTGFRATSTLSSPWVEFEFTPGTFTGGLVFEFDCDTDLGNGINGSAMAGMLIDITLLDGTKICGELVADPVDVNLSSFTF